MWSPGFCWHSSFWSGSFYVDPHLKTALPVHQCCLCRCPSHRNRSLVVDYSRLYQKSSVYRCILDIIICIFEQLNCGKYGLFCTFRFVMSSLRLASDCKTLHPPFLMSSFKMVMYFYIGSSFAGLHVFCVPRAYRKAKLQCCSSILFWEGFALQQKGAFWQTGPQNQTPETTENISVDWRI